LLNTLGVAILKELIIKEIKRLTFELDSGCMLSVVGFELTLLINVSWAAKLNMDLTHNRNYNILGN
jgi:hypothetical protein